CDSVRTAFIGSGVESISWRHRHLHRSHHGAERAARESEIGHRYSNSQDDSECAACEGAWRRLEKFGSAVGESSGARKAVIRHLEALGTKYNSSLSNSPFLPDNSRQFQTQEAVGMLSQSRGVHSSTK